MSKKEFFINAVRMIDVDGSTNIPIAKSEIYWLMIRSNQERLSEIEQIG